MALSLAGAAPDAWIPMFLEDQTADVQFETLRWIANSDLKRFLPDVEAVLSRSDVSYDLFEAAMAAWNTLRGKPEAGVRDVEILLTRVLDANSAPRLRAYALRLLPTQPHAAGKQGTQPVRNIPKELSIELLSELLAVNDETLSGEVIRTLAGDALKSQGLLASVASDSDRSDGLRAEAIAGLAAVSSQHRELLIELAGDQRQVVREEALRSLRFSDLSADETESLNRIGKLYPESLDLIQAVLEPGSIKANRPAMTDTAAWLERLDAVDASPDPESGRRVFHHSRLGSCSNCHRHHGRGNVVGPDLSAVGKRDNRESLLKSILDPSAEIAPEYQPRTILLNDGRVFTGIRLRSYTREQIRDANGQTRTFDRGDVESMVDSKVSFMPNGLVDALTDRELRDLLAFLQNAPRANAD